MKNRFCPNNSNSKTELLLENHLRIGSDGVLAVFTEKDIENIAVLVSTFSGVNSFTINFGMGNFPPTRILECYVSLVKQGYRVFLKDISGDFTMDEFAASRKASALFEFSAITPD
jgi:hypothetical protein